MEECERMQRRKQNKVKHEGKKMKIRQKIQEQKTMKKGKEDEDRRRYNNKVKNNTN